MATKKKYAARRVLRTPEGGTRIGFFDIQTGQEVPQSQLDQYEITSFDFGGKQPKDFEDEESDKPTEDKKNDKEDRSGDEDGDLGSSNYSSNPPRDTGLTAFAERPGASRGTGNIFEDFKAAYNNIKPTLMAAGIRAAGLQDDIGKAVGQGVGNAVEGVKDNVGNVVADVGSKVGGFLGGVFGGGQKEVNVKTQEAVANGAYSNAQVASNVKGINPVLKSIIDEAAQRSPYQVTIVSGERDGDPRLHGQNMAIDVQLTDPSTGQILHNYQDPATFRAYEQFAQTAMAVTVNEYPVYTDSLRWGGYFSGDIGQGGKYGAVDLMHLDFGMGVNGLGMLGGSWQNGLTDAQKAKVPGAVSVGMGDLNSWKGKLTPPGQSPIPEIQEAEKAVQAGPTVQAAQQQGMQLPNIGGALQGTMDNLRGLFGQGPATPVPQQNQQAMQAVQQTPQAFAQQPPVAPTPTQAAVTNMNIQPNISNVPVPPANIPMPTQQSITPTQAAVGQDLPAFTGYQAPQAPAPIMPTSINPNEFAGQVASINNQAKGDKNGAFNPFDNTEAVKNAFLDTINYAEGSPKANQLFGYGEVNSLMAHPDQKVYYNEGKDFSTAAGYMQINAPTWNDYAPKVGATTFELPDQKAVGWAIADDRYKQYTNGRDLLTDLTSGNQNAVMGAFSSLNKTWSSLPGGSQQRISLQDAANKFNDSLSSYTNPTITPSSKLDNTGSLAYNPSDISSQKASDKTSNSGFMSSSSGSEAGSLGSSSSSTKTSNGGFADKISDKSGNEGGSLGNGSFDTSGGSTKTSNASSSTDRGSDKNSNRSESGSLGGSSSYGSSSSSSSSSGKISNSSSSSDKTSNSSKSYDSITSSGPSWDDVQNF